MTKVCSKCGLEREISYFPKNKKSPDGLNYWCKSCNCVYCRSWKQTHSEERKAYTRAYNLAHKEARRAYYHMNHERIKKYQQGYKRQNRDYINLMERLRRQKLKAKAARDAAKRDRQQTEPAEINDTQPRLFNA